MYKSVFSVFFLLIISFKSFSQSDSIIINQDPKLKKVIELKKIVNQEAFTSGQYTIQVFSGNFTDYKNLMDKPESIISSTIITRLFLISVLISLDIFIEPVEFIPS